MYSLPVTVVTCPANTLKKHKNILVEWGRIINKRTGSLLVIILRSAGLMSRLLNTDAHRREISERFYFFIQIPLSKTCSIVTTVKCLLQLADIMNEL